MTKTKKANKNWMYEKIVNKILEAMEQGKLPWEKPWYSRYNGPKSLSTKKEYRGINNIMLGWENDQKGYDCEWWCTFAQAIKLGGRVRKGEKSMPVMFFKPFVTTVEEEDKETGKIVEKDKMRWTSRLFYVFNAQQCEGIDIPAKEVREKIDPLDEAESIIGNYTDCPTIKMGESSAYYSPKLDYIGIPSRNDFKTADGFYKTLFHEMTHSTGAESRLKRKGVMNFDTFGSEQYGREELIAEFGASFLCAEAGIDNTEKHSAAYIQGWMKSIKDDPKMIVTAASQAQKASEYILGSKDE